MANLSLREVNQSKLENTPIVEGQLVFCYDTGNIYHDTTSGRTQVGHDVFNVTELPLAPLNGKVYCLPDGEMLLYLGDWVKLNYKYDVATETEDGLQSAEDKEKLNGIAAGANKYSHPGYTSKSNGFYKVTVDGTGHVSATTAVTKADITGLGIPAQDTTYSAATSSTLGLVKVGSNISNSYGTISLTKANVTSALGYTPPTTNTTYGNATTSSSGLMSSSDKSKLDGIAAGANKYSHPGYTSKSNGFYKVTVDGTGHVSATTAVTKADITGLGIPAQDTTYSAATSSTLGLVKVGSNISNSYGTISLTKANVTSALGYTPPTTNTTYGNATTSSSGLMSSSDKSKLDGIASGANKTVVDNALSQGSANPVANYAITKRLQYLYSFKISRDKWNESSDKSNWNVIVSWSDSKGNAITATASSATPNLTTGMSLGPAMMERTSSLRDNIILSGELSMINQGQIYVCETNKLSFIVKRRPVCDLMLYFYARQWTV